MSNLIFDGIGYVSNRGFSKYWGVSRDLVDLKSWRVQINVKNTNRTFTFDHRVTEQTAAMVAACLFNYDDLPNRVVIELYGSCFIMDKSKGQFETVSCIIDPGIICSTRIRHADLKQETVDIFEEKSDSNITEEEKKLVLDLYSLICDDKLSEKTSSLLKDMLNIFTSK